MNTITTTYRPELPIYFAAYLKQEAKNRGVSLQKLVAEALTDWITADEDLEYKLTTVPPEAHEAWVEYKKELARKQRREADLKQERNIVSTDDRYMEVGR
jgi:hypothetical protein